MESKNKIDVQNREQWIEEDLSDNNQNPETESLSSSKPRFRKLWCFVLGPREKQVGPFMAFSVNITVILISSYLLT